MRLIVSCLVFMIIVHTSHHEEHHQWTEQKEGKWQDTQKVGRMFRGQEEANDEKEGDQNPGDWF